MVSAEEPSSYVQGERVVVPLAVTRNRFTKQLSLCIFMCVIVCVYVCDCVCIYVCMFICVYVYMCVYMCVCVRVYAHACPEQTDEKNV